MNNAKVQGSGPVTAGKTGVSRHFSLHPWRRRRKRAFIAVPAVVALVLAAVGIEAIAGLSGPVVAPAGELVTVAGSTMHIDCSGIRSAGPTVVLEAGLGEAGLSWAGIQGPLATSTRVCSYDRPGYGWSAEREEAWSASSSAEQLRELLRLSGETGPYILVSHSLGSLVARNFREQNPQEVAGMVMLDPTDDSSIRTAGQPVLPVAQRALFKGLIALGAVRITGKELIPAMVGGAPPKELLENVAVLYDAEAVDASIRELKGSVPSAVELARSETRSWADLPVRVISSVSAAPAERDFHRGLAQRSARGVHISASVARHYIQYAEPGLVLSAIEEVVQETGVPLTHREPGAWRCPDSA